MMQDSQGTPCQARSDDKNIKPLRDTPHPAFPKSGKEPTATLNSIQSRIVGQVERDGIILTPLYL